MFTTISHEEIDQYIEKQKEMVLIDLRNRASYKQCHLVDAINLPFSEIFSRIPELPKDKVLIFYCSRGGQSMQTCRYLENQGYEVMNVANGISYYKGKYLVCR